MAIRAALFDVGDTLVEHWLTGDELHAKIRARLRAAFGEREWYDEWIRGDIEPVEAKRGYEGWRDEPARVRQETNAWYERWFREHRIDLDGIDLDRLRAAMCVPLDEVSTPATGAFQAVRWCKDHGLAVVLVSNTLSRGDREIVEDWRRFGLHDAIDGVVSSHSVGWRKPHPAIFQQALEVARARPAEAFHVGDSLVADVWGAKELGMRAIWRRVPRQQINVVAPDAIVDEMTELPGVVARWLEAAERIV